jgi:hypothetical protein
MFALLVWASGLGVASGASFKLPPLSGELSGKFKATALHEEPEIAWKLKISPVGADRRQVEVDLTTKGGRLRVRADLDAVTSDGTWEIVESELDATAWLALVSPKLGKLGVNLAASGNIQLSGKGEVTDGRPSGKLSVEWSNGSVNNPVDDWVLQGVSLKGDLTLDAADLGAMSSHAPWELAVQTISSRRFGARNLFLKGKFNQNRTASLLEARIELAGGEVTVAPSTVSLFPPVLDFRVHVDRVGLQDLVALVPGSVADARGRIDGSVRLGWSQAAGLQIGEGSFVLRDDEVAIFRLVPAPGFLTQRVPERLALLPGWTGPIGRWLATPNPVYGDVSDIELGHKELQIVNFELTLTPKGDEQNRTGVVRISARPTTAGGVVKLVNFDLNVFGSVSELLKWSMFDRAEFEVR